MKIDISTHGSFRVLKIHEELQVISELSELRILIEGYIKMGVKKIAVCFTESSYIYSGAIGVLVHCFKQVMNEGGEFCIIEPQESLASVLETTGVARIMKIYPSSSDLPGQEED
ncbi:STAS domain-containing protein [Fibrobacterota bacterium]